MRYPVWRFSSVWFWLCWWCYSFTRLLGTFIVRFVIWRIWISIATYWQFRLHAQWLHEIAAKSLRPCVATGGWSLNVRCRLRHFYGKSVWWQKHNSHKTLLGSIPTIFSHLCTSIHKFTTSIDFTNFQGPINTLLWHCHEKSIYNYYEVKTGFQCNITVFNNYKSVHTLQKSMQNCEMFEWSKWR